MVVNAMFLCPAPQTAPANHETAKSWIPFPPKQNFRLWAGESRGLGLGEKLALPGRLLRLKGNLQSPCLNDRRGMTASAWVSLGLITMVSLSASSVLVMMTL